MQHESSLAQSSALSSMSDGRSSVMHIDSVTDSTPRIVKQHLRHSLSWNFDLRRT